MRWITPQELAKVAKKSESASATVPERTIRHMAAQNRFQVKKEGKTWLINPSSVLSAGLYIPQEILESWKIQKQTAEVLQNKPPDVPATLPRAEGTPVREPRKYTKLCELGVYAELKEIFLKENSTFSDSIREYFKQTLYHLALGFFEYPKLNKAECFRRARKCLVGALVEDDLGATGPSSWHAQIESSIIPGIAGLIRKQEGVKRGVRDKVEDRGKGGAVLR